MEFGDFRWTLNCQLTKIHFYLLYYQTFYYERKHIAINVSVEELRSIVCMAGIV